MADPVMNQKSLSSEETDTTVDVLLWRDAPQHEVEALFQRGGLEIRCVAEDAPIPGSFWGEPEAGLIQATLYLRGDTPLHSALHEACHYFCMTPDRRKRLHTDAGGDHDEENAVCYLQILLASGLTGVGDDRIMADMDRWGYSFRLGSAAAWFRHDAADARDWLRDRDILDNTGQVQWTTFSPS